MRVVVVREFLDVHTGDFHPISEKLTVTKERFEEIEKVGKFVVDISDETSEEVSETPVTAPPEEETTVSDEQPVTPAKSTRRNRAKKESEDK